MNLERIPHRTAHQQASWRVTLGLLTLDNFTLISRLVHAILLHTLSSCWCFLPCFSIPSFVQDLKPHLAWKSGPYPSSQPLPAVHLPIPVITLPLLTPCTRLSHVFGINQGMSRLVLMPQVHSCDCLCLISLARACSTQPPTRWAGSYTLYIWRSHPTLSPSQIHICYLAPFKGGRKHYRIMKNFLEKNEN